MVSGTLLPGNLLFLSKVGRKSNARSSNRVVGSDSILALECVSGSWSFARALQVVTQSEREGDKRKVKRVIAPWDRAYILYPNWKIQRERNLEEPSARRVIIISRLFGLFFPLCYQHLLSASFHSCANRFRYPDSLSRVLRGPKNHGSMDKEVPGHRARIAIIIAPPSARGTSRSAFHTITRAARNRPCPTSYLSKNAFDVRTRWNLINVSSHTSIALNERDFSTFSR